MARFTQSGTGTGTQGPPGPAGEDAVLPQDLDTTDSPTFSKITLTSNGEIDNITIGDDVILGDGNIANHLVVIGNQDATKGGIVFGDDKTEKVSTDGSNLSLNANNDIILYPGSTYAYIGEPTVGGETRIAQRGFFGEVDRDIIPATDNEYVLGNSDYRWKSISIGEGTIYITDATTNAQAELTIDDSIFKINGVAQAQLPDVKVTNLTFADNHTQAHSSDILLISHKDGNQTPFETVDLTKQILVMSDGTWTLPDGAEGQIMYFIQGNGGSAEDSYLNVAHLKYNDNGLATQMNNGVWSPFNYESGYPQSPMCTAIFTDGYWSFSNGRKR